MTSAETISVLYCV